MCSYDIPDDSFGVGWGEREKSNATKVAYLPNFNNYFKNESTQYNCSRGKYGELNLSQNLV